MPEALPYGAWPSPIAAADIAGAGVRLLALSSDLDDLYWLEGRPSEGGRQAILRLRDGQTIEVTPPDFNARTRVHEYGGGEHWVHDGVLFATRFEDQRLYRIDQPGDARPITPEPDLPAGDRYADGAVTPDGRLIVCVRERHHADGREADNELVVLPADGSEPPRVIFTGPDFVAAPRLSPDGARLAWLSWDHPRMPWDGTELWLADLSEDGTLGPTTLVAGGPTESITQPRWSPDGRLLFISDRSGWWNLYRLEADGGQTRLASRPAEFAGPDWAFALASYGFLPDGTVIATHGSVEGAKLLAIRDDAIEELPAPYTSISHLHVAGNRVAFIGASATSSAAVVAGPAAPIEAGEEGGRWRVLRRSRTDELDAAYVSLPEHITFPTANGATAHAYCYAPRNPEISPPEDERPPLIVISHGGPTGATSTAYNPAIQFWTTRGFAVVDVDYRGSTGYGRAYRHALDGLWGIADTEDCIAAAAYLAARGDADGARLCIRGGSAGGYTTLCALAFHDLFRAGASYFGVADAEALATDTHKFESRYLDSMIGPYPEAAATYRERSPIHFAGQIKAALILFQGLEDQIVPPAQAEAMVAALAANHLPHAYLAFEGEQHGFRRAENIIRTLEAELSFYAQILGFTPAGDIDPVHIENLD